jgi:hypothetical protein
MWDNLFRIANAVYFRIIIQIAMVVFFIHFVVHVFIFKNNDIKLNVVDTLLGASSISYTTINIIQKVRHKRR